MMKPISIRPFISYVGETENNWPLLLDSAAPRRDSSPIFISGVYLSRSGLLKRADSHLRCTK